MTKNIMKAHTTERKQQISSTLIYQIVSSRGHFNTWSNILNLHPCLFFWSPFLYRTICDVTASFFFQCPFLTRASGWSRSERWHLLWLGTVLTWQRLSAPQSRYDCIFLHLQTWQCLFSIELEVAFRSIDHVPFSVCLYLFHQPIPSDHIPIEIPGFFTN